MINTLMAAATGITPTATAAEMVHTATVATAIAPMATVVMTMMTMMAMHTMAAVDGNMITTATTGKGTGSPGTGADKIGCNGYGE